MAKSLPKKESSAVDAIIAAFNESAPSSEDRVKLIGAMLSKLNAIPFKKVIDTKLGLVINGKELSPEQIIALSEGATALRDNSVRKLIFDQVRFLSVNLGVHQGTNVDNIVMSRAALWVLQEIDDLINTFAK